MKRIFKGWILLEGFFCLFCLIGHPVWLNQAHAEDEEGDSYEKAQEEEAHPAQDTLTINEDVDCQDLEEFLNILVPLQQTVSEEFALISDPALCPSVSDTCEYFFRQVKSAQKKFHSSCDKDYEATPPLKCDYDANPCVKEIRRVVVGGMIR